MSTGTEVRPFRGLRFDPAVTGDLGRVLAPPYDVITPEAQAALYDSSPYNVVRVEYARERPGETRHQAAAASLRAWLSVGALRRDPRPAFYAVRHRFPHGGGSRERWELVAALRLVPWSSGIVLPHEDTHEEPKADRLELMRACRANVSPIMALYRDRGGLAARLLADAARSAAAAHASGPAGESLDLWVVTDPDRQRDLGEAVQAPFYVADGHHRYETALAYRDLAPPLPGGRPRAADYVMAGLISLEDPGLLCLPYHRLLRALTGEARTRLEERVEALFQGEAVDVSGLTPGQVADHFARRVATGPRPLLGLVRSPGDSLRLLRPRAAEALTALAPGRSAAWRSLSPCHFSEGLLRPALGLTQQEAEARGLLSYPRDAAEAVAEVRAGRQEMAFLLDGVPVAAITAVSEAGERLPPKSTYFHPKLATGLVLNPLEGPLEAE